MLEAWKRGGRIVLAMALLLGLGLPAAADFGDGGKWERGPFGMFWDENDWPEWTPMYWMEEFANELDDDDDWGKPWNRFGGQPWGGQPWDQPWDQLGNPQWGGAPNPAWPGGRFQHFDGIPFDDWYDDDNDWPEWTPMYWMEEFADAIDDDDDDYYGGGYYPRRPFNSYPPGYYPPNAMPPPNAPINPLTGERDPNAQLDPRRLDQQLAAERFRNLPRYGKAATPRQPAQGSQADASRPSSQQGVKQRADQGAQQAYKQGYRRGYRVGRNGYQSGFDSPRAKSPRASSPRMRSPRPVRNQPQQNKQGKGCFPG